MGADNGFGTLGRFGWGSGRKVRLWGNAGGQERGVWYGLLKPDINCNCGAGLKLGEAGGMMINHGWFYWPLS